MNVPSSSSRARALLLPLFALASIAGPTVPSALASSGAEEWVPVDSDLWIPVPPESPARRVSLHREDGSSVHGRWTLAAPGDTLRFRVRGTGTLQVESRAVFATDANVRRFRLGVRTDEDILRRLVRRAAFEDEMTWEGWTVARRVSEVDEWETPLVDGSEEIVVFLREERSAPLLVRVLVRGAVERPREIDEPDRPTVRRERGGADWDLDTEWEVAVAGYDDNPYLAPKDVADTTEVRDAWYWPVDVELSVDLDDALPFELSLDYDLQAWIYDDDILNETRHRLALRQTWRDVGVGPLRDGRLRLEQRLRTKDDTFFGRGEFEERETGSILDPTGRISFGDRFDWREFRLRGDASTVPAAGWELDLEAHWTRLDYVEDYEGDPDIYSLDQHRFGGEIEIVREVGALSTLGLRAGVERWNYDEKFSRDADGTEITTLPTRLRRWPVELEFERDPDGGFGFGLSLGVLNTDDLREGYWDRSTLIASFDWEWEQRDAWTIGGRVRRSVTDYENSTVGNDVGAPLREKDSWRLSLEGEWEVRPAWTLFAGWDHENLENNSRRFAYQRSRTRLGLHVEF